MCNHYEKNQEVIDWAAVTARAWAVSTGGDVVVPDDLPQYPPHTYPKAMAPVLIQTEAGRSIASMRWGVRVEIKTPTKPVPVIKFVTNARDDSLTKFTWRFSTMERRCLIPAIGYFEPGLGPEGARGEVRFSLVNRPNFFIAGLWDKDHDELGTRSFTMVTTAPNAYATPFHDRMPLVLHDSDAQRWLGHTPLAPEVLAELVRPYEGADMAHTEIAAVQRAAKPIRKADLQQASGELDLFSN